MKEDTFASRAMQFYRDLEPPRLPRGTGVRTLCPYDDDLVLHYLERFFQRYFNDTNDRTFVFGINPGRFGSGTTGITFTDPVALDEICKIDNHFEKRRELSSEFVYRFIAGWGGPREFYKHFFLTAVSPLGFTYNDKNYNYYDNLDLFAKVRPYIVATLKEQLILGARRDAAIVLGTGKNYQFFCALNEKYHFFENIYVVEHPRFIMQYRRKHLAVYIEKYEEIFGRVSGGAPRRPRGD